MNEEYPQGIPPEDVQFFPPLARMTFIERYNISPVLFAFIALVFVFILYQVVGGLLTLLLFGLKPLQSQALGFRIATGVGQIIFIFVPTLLLVRFVSFDPAEYLRLKFPDVRLFFLAIIGIFSLQQVLQVFMVVQDKIPLPHALEKFIEPLKKMIEEMYQMLVNSTTVPELLLVLFIVAFIPAIAEEFLFRGLVQGCFERAFGSWKGVFVTGVIFGAYHLNPFSFIPLAALGIYLGFLAMQAGSIWVSIIAHFFNNAVACLAVYYHLDEDAIVTGSPTSMSTVELLLTAVISGVIFIVSTYYIMKLTRKTPPEAISFPPPTGA
ncbi:MAG: CPBP family intramembrane glutamic endopeptidase [Bacteroidota bacterium]